MAKKQEKANFILARKVQSLAKKQNLNRTPDNVAIGQMAKLLGDKKEKNTASINAVKANASKKYNGLVKKANKAIVDYQKKVVDAIEDNELKKEVKKIPIETFK